MIELLVVILIVGVLTAIAVPAFLNQKSKANDASGKELARTAQTAMETVAAANGGSYTTVASPTDLSNVEKSINTNSSNGQAYLSSATGLASGFTVVATAAVTGDTFTITNSSGTITRTCSGTGGGCPSGSW